MERKYGGDWEGVVLKVGVKENMDWCEERRKLQKSCNSKQKIFTKEYTLPNLKPQNSCWTHWNSYFSIF